MYEVEAKVAIDFSTFKRIKTSLDSDGYRSESHKKFDTYHYLPKDGVVRTRGVKNKYTFDIKHREVSGGVEKNLELEWKILDINKWTTLLKSLKVPELIKKQKAGYTYRLDDYVLELNEIEGLGYFLEIEILVADSSMLEAAQKRIESLFKTWGYGKNDFEKRPYLELLNHV